MAAEERFRFPMLALFLMIDPSVSLTSKSFTPPPPREGHVRGVMAVVVAIICKKLINTLSKESSRLFATFCKTNSNVDLKNLAESAVLRAIRGGVVVLQRRGEDAKRSVGGTKREGFVVVVGKVK